MRIDQSEYILEKEKRGFFVDIGAYDGVTGSNTLLLEQNGWDGICVEPNKEPFKRLDLNRRCSKHNAAISDFNGESWFMSVAGYAEQISCIERTAPREHLERIETELDKHGGEVSRYAVPCYTFSTLVKEKDITYLSIDAESHELYILQGIDFSYHNIKYISFEKNPYDKNDCGKFLESMGYSHVNTIGVDYFYKKND